MSMQNQETGPWAVTSAELGQKVRELPERMREETRQVLEGSGRLVLLDCAVGFLLIFRSVSLFSQSFVALLLLLYVAFRATTRPRYSVRQANLVAAVFLLAFFYLAVVSYLGGESTPMQIAQRLMRMGAVVGLALFIATGRIDFRSLLMGLSAGLLFNAAGFYAGVAPADYGSYLSGWLQDKNVAGLYYACVALLVFAVYSKPWQRVTLLLLALPLLWDTGSRTSLGGFLLGIFWLFFAGRLNLPLKLLLGGAVMWLFEWAQDTFSDSAVFGDRSGTDWFRERVDAASWEKIQQTPWQGRGVGQAYVRLDSGDRMFFHNSYWTLFVEGGWLWLLAVLGLMICAVFVWKQSVTPRLIGAEAATVLLLVCSWRLGEVILTLPWGLVLGLALSYLPRAPLASRAGGRRSPELSAYREGSSA